MMNIVADNTQLDIDTLVEFKLKVLREFYILRKDDKRTKTVAKILKNLGTFEKMDIALYDVVRGRKSLNQFIAERKEGI